MDSVAPTVITTPKTADEDSRQLPPSAVRAIVRRHDEVVDKEIDRVRVIVATYKTDFWSSTGVEGKGTAGIATDMRLEVNRVWPIATTLAATLYPQAARVAVMPSYEGKGSAPMAQAALNDWSMRHTMQDRVLFGVTQCVLTGMIGWHIGYDAGVGRPTDRTYLTVVPRSDLLLDYGVTDTRFERYRGRVVWMPRKQAEEKYNVSDLVGTTRADPWQYGTTTAGGRSIGTPVNPGGFGSSERAGGNGSDSEADGEFVRVLEFYNLTDPLATRRGHVYQGRMEVYILGQRPEISDKPIVVEAMPFATSSGAPLSPTVPLIFASDPIYPYRAISVLERLMPLQREYNILRSLMAIQFRRSAARKGIGRGGVLESDQMEAFLNGDDATVAMTTDDYKGTLEDAARWVDPPKVDPMLLQHRAALEQETTWVLAQAPNFRGEVTNSTKYETEAANKQTEVELAMYARRLYNSLTEADTVALRAFIACMQDVTDSAGSFTPTDPASSHDVAADVHLGAVGAVTTKQVVDAAKADAGEDPVDALATNNPTEAAARATPTPAAAAPASPDAVATSAPAPVVVERPFPVVVDGQTLQVGVGDLDATFEIEFVDGVRTPMREDAINEVMVNLLPTIGGLWKTAQEPGPVGTFARIQLQTLVERLSLPKTWMPDAVDKANELRAKKTAPPSPPPPEAPDATMAGTPEVPSQAAPAPAPTPDVATLRAALLRARAAIAAGDAPAAARLLQPIAALGPRIRDLLDTAAAAKGPGEPATSLSAAIDQILSALGAQPGAQPTEA